MLASVQNYVETFAGTPADGPVRLNIMCGLNVMAGWINIDPFMKGHPTVKHIEVLKMDPRRLDFPDNSVDEITSVSLEHIPHPETVAVLNEWLRVLKHGGTLDVLVPDAEWCFAHWLNLPEEARWGFKLANICGLQRDAGQVHYTLFTKPRLKQLFEAVGFDEVIVNEEWCKWNDIQKIRCRGTKRRDPRVLTERERQALGVAWDGKHSPTDDTTRYFMDNPLPNVDYDWIHNKVLYPRMMQELESLRKEVRHFEGALRAEAQIATLERQLKDALSKELSEQRKAAQSQLNEKLQLEAQVVALKSENESLATRLQETSAQLAAASQILEAAAADIKKTRAELNDTMTELERFKSSYLRIMSLPFMKTASKLRRLL